MSRHRDVRNLDYQAELDDDALSDGGEELTEEQELQMNQAFEEVRGVIGDEAIDVIGERPIREALWEFYFNAAQTVEWAMEEIDRRRRAEERKDGDDFYGENPQAWSRLPKIMQAQPEGGYLDIDEPQMNYPNRLSTITEHTEKTEVQSMYTKPESTILGRSRSQATRDPTNQSIDPSTIPPSPTLSAIQRLSLYEGPPSNPPSLSCSSGLTPKQSLESVPAIEVIPDIPDFQSKSSKPPALPAKPQSKLSKLAASSRAPSTISSRSGAGSATTSTSIRTYPPLRPSAHSQLGVSSGDSTPGSAVSKELPPVPYEQSFDQSSVRTSIVRDAIANAMRLEEMDKTETPERSRESVLRQDSPSVVSEQIGSQVSVPRSLSDRQSKNPTPTGQPSSKPPSSVARSPSPPKQPSPKPMASSALSRVAPSASSATSTVSSLKTASSQRTVSTAKPLSKLALLAQQKADASRAPKLPEPKTEYLTPIANGSSVTTAITTSYQTLYSLTDPARSNIIPKLDVVPLHFSSGAPSPKSPPASGGGKTSKLAMKVRRAQEKAQTPQSPAPPPEPEYVAPVLPIFQPSPVHARASPSAFAQVLVDNTSVVSSEPVRPPLDEPSWIGPDLRTQWQQAMAPTTISHKSSSTTIDSADSHPHRRRKKGSSAVPPPSVTASAKSFAFDTPSPDDTVLQARAGAGLRKGTASSRSVTTASTAA